MPAEPRIALVTGGARRLGRAISLALARAGYDVAISYRSSAADARRTVAALRAEGRRAAAFRCDVRNRAEVARLVERTRRALGPVDLLVINAGVFRRTPLEKTTESDWRFHMDTNLEGAFWCAQCAGLEMARRGGAIVMIADVAGLRPWPGYLPYSISKAGMVALTRGLAIRLAPRVRVNAVAPGPVLPPEEYSPAEAAQAAAQTLLRRLGSAEDVAAAVVYLASAPYVTGVVLPVDGGRHLT